MPAAPLCRCLLSLASMLVWVGCATTSPLIVPSPVSTDEQQAQILKLVPVGTPREEALETLRREGVEVQQGASTTIYYCDLWQRPDGSRWHLDVALLFDRQGRLYRTRSASALVDSDDSTNPVSSETPPRLAPETVGNPLTGAASPIGTAAFPSDSGTPVRSRRGSGTRTPFGH
jgi:hypothetical protein